MSQKENYIGLRAIVDTHKHTAKVLLKKGLNWSKCVILKLVNRKILYKKSTLSLSRNVILINMRIIDFECNMIFFLYTKVGYGRFECRKNRNN